MGQNAIRARHKLRYKTTNGNPPKKERVSLGPGNAIDSLLPLVGSC